MSQPVSPRRGVRGRRIRRRSVVALDWAERHDTLFEGGLEFVKDADPIENGDWLVADTKHDRVLLWNEDDPEPKQSFHLGTDANPYEADYLSGGDSFV